MDRNIDSLDRIQKLNRLEENMRTSTETLEDRIESLEAAVADLTAKYNRLIYSLDEFGDRID